MEYPRERRVAASKMLLIVLITLVLALGSTGLAVADDATTTPADATETAAEAPVLDYTFTWPTFLLCFGLVIAYYIFIFRMSEKEFKGVVAERFGPKREQGEAG